MSEKEPVLVIITGGTIEALYNPEEGTPYVVPVPKTVSDSAIPGAMARMGLGDGVVYYPLRMKDSKEITAPDLDHILHHIAEYGYDRVVIVHGTDTMPLHARYLKRHMAEWGTHQGMDAKTIVFTGAMGPLRDKHGAWRDPHVTIEKNDGWDNLRRALADARAAAPGVYIEIGHGPQEADTIRKQVELDEPDASGVRKVKRSGFVADDPARHREEGF